MKGLYFNGRQNETLIIRKKENKSYPTVIKEKHVVIAAEPGSKNISHLTSTSGRGNSIAEVSDIFFWKKTLMETL